MGTLDLMINQDFNCGLLVFCYNTHFVNSFASFELLSNFNNLGKDFLFLRQIYEFYLNSTFPIITQIEPSILNFDFASIGFFLICISLFMRLCYVSFYQIFVYDFQIFFFVLAFKSIFKI